MDRQNITKLVFDFYNLEKADKYTKISMRTINEKIEKSFLSMQHKCTVLGKFSGCYSPVLESLQGQ
jgi:hypothetical protein